MDSPEEIQETVIQHWVNRAQNAEARFGNPIVCMCGSSRFKQTWLSEGYRLSREGYIVLYLALSTYHGQDPDPIIKRAMDNLHLQKIKLADWVYVLDVNGYIGESTRKEIEYAESLGRSIKYLSKEFPGYIEPTDKLEAEYAALYEAMQGLTEACGRLFKNGEPDTGQYTAYLEKLKKAKDALHYNLSPGLLRRLKSYKEAFHAADAVIHYLDDLWEGKWSEDRERTYPAARKKLGEKAGAIFRLERGNGDA